VSSDQLPLITGADHISSWKHLPIAAVVAELQKSKIHEASKPCHELAETLWKHGLTATYDETQLSSTYTPSSEL
jgi:hypothetical protein